VLNTNKLILTGDVGSFTTRIDFVFDQHVLKKVSSEARFADTTNQFRVRKNGLGWQILGNAASVNATILNGVELSQEAKALNDGDEIAVKGRTSGIVALKIKVCVSETSASRPGVLAGTGKTVAARLPPEQMEFQDLVVRGWRNFAHEIDISGFVRRNNWSFPQVKEAFYACKYNHPEIFYLVDRGICSRIIRSNGQIRDFIITNIQYYFPRGEYASRKAELDKAVSDAMKSIAHAKGPVEKALGLHDYLIRTCEYDVKAAKEKDGTPLARTVYSVLVRHLAVCEGYAMAYRYLLDAAGISSKAVFGVGIPHMWNYVQIEGKWYHVDVTWDDPVYSGAKPSESFVSREHFLMSDKKAMATGHPDWDIAGLPPAEDESYDERKW